MSMGVSAQQPEAMNIQTNIGAAQSILLDKIKNIEFVDEALVFVTTSGSFQIAMDDIHNIVFGEYNEGPTTGIATIDANSVRVMLQGDVLSVESDHAIRSLYLVDIAGKMVASQR